MEYKKIIRRALVNIRKDRETTTELLENLRTSLQNSNNAVQSETGFILAKYVETLQRSNEQLVKIAALLKPKDNKEEKISEDERDEIYDQLNVEKDKKKPRLVPSNKADN